MKKILSGLLIGAFVFGLGAADVQPVSAASLDKVKETKEKYDKVKKTKDKIDKAQDIFGKNKKDGDNSNRPEPPKDENGNPIAPPDRNSDDNNSNDKFGGMKDKYNKAKEIFK